MKMNRAKALLLVPVIGLLAAGCQFSSGGASGGFTCNNSKTGCHASGSYSAAPDVSVSQSAPIPGVTVTVTPAPLPQPTVTVTSTEYVDWRSCWPSDPSQGYLDNTIAGGVVSDTSTQIAYCLRIPQGNIQDYLEQLQKYAYIGYTSGLFRSREGRDEFANGEDQVICPDGRVIYSMFQIYATYGIAS
jgi:hypothetical protein